MNRSGRIRKAGMILLSAVLFLSGCQGGVVDGTVSVESAGEELNVALSFIPSTMDPQKAVDVGSVQYLDPCTGLLYRPDEKGIPVPELASGYEVSEDGLTYTIYLKDNIYYSNGDPITARDFVYSFRRIADPYVASSSIFLITDVCMVKNAPEVNAGSLPLEDLGVTASDDRTLVVELSEPCPYFLHVLTKAPLSPSSEEFVRQCGESYATNPETMLSSGPFVVDRYEPLGLQTHYKKNPYYVYADQVELSGLTFRQVANEQQAQMAYQTKETDIISIGGDYLELSEGDPCLTTRTGGNIYYLTGNYERSRAWADRDIRMALSLAIDRESIVKNYMHSNAQALTRIVPQTFATEPDGKDFAEDPAAYADTCGYDVNAAREHWEKGLKNLGVRALTMEVSVQTGSQQFFEILKDQLENNLPGLTLEIRPLSGGQYIENAQKGDFELLMMGWVADYPDPNSFLSLLLSTSEMNYGGYENEQYDALLLQSIRETNAEKRMELLHQAEDAAMQDAAIVPLYAAGNSWLVSEKVEGVVIGFEGGLVKCSFASVKR